MSAGIRPQCFFIYWIATVVSLPRDDKGDEVPNPFVIPAQAGIGSIKFVLRITDK